MQLLGRIRSSRSGRGQLLQDMKKVVYKLDITDITAKQKAMKAVSTLQGIDFIAIDMNTKTLTVIGLVDPVDVVGKLRKNWPTDIISVGPAKEPEQPKEEAPKEEAKKEDAEEANKEEPKKEEGKGDQEGKEGEAKKEEGKKEEDEKKKEVPPEEVIKGYNYRAYNYHPNYVTAPHFYSHSMEENPNACVIS